MDSLPDVTANFQTFEDVALDILREAKLTKDDREALEKAVRVARSLRKVPPHAEGKP